MCCAHVRVSISTVCAVTNWHCFYRDALAYLNWLTSTIYPHSHRHTHTHTRTITYSRGFECSHSQLYFIGFDWLCALAYECVCVCLCVRMTFLDVLRNFYALLEDDDNSRTHSLLGGSIDFS